MISVLIPTYNWDVYPLVSSLHRQLLLTKKRFEIIVVDDASTNFFSSNHSLCELSHTSFESLHKNIVRSAIRNYLARKSNYPWLLFLDCDAIVGDLFIEKYIRTVKSASSNVIVGGMAYNLGNEKLRYKFGKKREEVNEEERKSIPDKYFFSANFMIKKQVFNSVNFDESLKGYGYEDLLFVKELKKDGWHIEHIENPIFHAEVDEDIVFINKTKEALLNLVTLINTEKLEFSDTRISKTYKRFYPFVLGLKYFHKFFEKLALKRSSLFFFDLFRLSYLSKFFKDRS